METLAACGRGQEGRRTADVRLDKGGRRCEEERELEAAHLDEERVLGDGGVARCCVRMEREERKEGTRSSSSA